MHRGVRYVVVCVSVCVCVQVYVCEASSVASSVIFAARFHGGHSREYTPGLTVTLTTR